MKENKILATTWLFLASFLIVSAGYILSTSGKYLVPSILGISIILFLMGRQRLTKYQIQQSKFQLYIRSLAIVVAISAGAVGATMANV
ncbi:hypothetical protein ACRN92_02575 [Shewanella ulleungensis]